MKEEFLERKHSYEELAFTCEKYYLPFIQQFIKISNETNVLEIECGEGGNLKPFVQKGCKVTGVDRAPKSIQQATGYLNNANASVKLYSADIYSVDELECTYDLILVHEVIERVKEKKPFLERLKKFLKPHGVVFIGFHAWHMPYGGHQYLCRNKLAARLPFTHLLPVKVYQSFLYYCCREEQTLINKLMRLRNCKTTIEQFRKLLSDCDYIVKTEQLYFIEPWCDVKFKLRPKRLMPFICDIPHVRNFFTTSCFYILEKNNYHIQIISDGAKNLA